jgi:predicted glycosyltransferase
VARWWIDVVNAPHATFFRPIVQRLLNRGDEVVITTWDRGNTRALSSIMWPEAIQVGQSGFTTPILSKGTAILRRSFALAREVQRRAPDVALGHNSYSQLLTARLLGIPSITAMDY